MVRIVLIEIAVNITAQQNMWYVFTYESEKTHCSVRKNFSNLSSAFLELNKTNGELRIWKLNIAGSRRQDDRSKNHSSFLFAKDNCWSEKCKSTVTFAFEFFFEQFIINVLHFVRDWNQAEEFVENHRML